MAIVTESPLNPFRFGSVVIDEFADRESELAEVEADMRNGQDLVIFAPRRLGKSSLVLKAAAGVRRKKALVAYLNVMTAPNKTRFAERLAAAIYADVAAPKAKLRDKALAMFQGPSDRPDHHRRSHRRSSQLLVRRRPSPRPTSTGRSRCCSNCRRRSPPNETSAWS